jgi:hypothetical protein
MGKAACLSDTSVFAKIDNFSPATFNSLRAIAIDAHMSMTQVAYKGSQNFAMASKELSQ